MLLGGYESWATIYGVARAATLTCGFVRERRHIEKECGWFWGSSVTPRAPRKMIYTIPLTNRPFDMFRIITPISALLLLTACSDPHPFDFGTGGTTTGGVTDNTTGTTTDEAAEDTGTLDIGTSSPDGTAAPTATGSIFRFESRDGSGGGLVTSVTYNSVDDEFTVDNLGFDGANVYERGAAVDTLGVVLRQYAVYDADDIAFDELDGDPINQNGPYRAIIGVSDNLVDGEARNAFAIVRTGGYRDYGFGGFIYQRNGGVTLPTTGQAHFGGEYAGIRVFQGAPGL